MSIRLLALDIDGTLAVRGDQVLPRTRASLHRAADAGIEVVIATGRRYRTTQRVAAALGLDVHCISLGGALVKDPEANTLHEVRFASATVRALVGAIRAEGHSAIVQRDSVIDGSDFMIDGHLPWNGWTSDYMVANQDHAEWHADLAAVPHDDALVVGAYGTRAALESVAARAIAEIDESLTTVVMPLPGNSGAPGGHYLEVASARACKWQGLQVLARGLGIDESEICAVGDQLNDLSMIRNAALGVAMGNAADEVQQAADRVTAANDADGIADLVDDLLADRDASSSQ